MNNEPKSENSVLSKPERLHPDEQARLAARSEGNQLANVEGYAREHTRAAQQGERDAIQTALNSKRDEKKMHRRKARKARRRRNRAEETIRDPGSRIEMGILAIVVLIFLILGLLGAIGAEQNGASRALLETGAFSIDTIGKGILMTMTAVTVGFALKLACSAMPPHWRRWAFGLACAALVALFVTWSWNFATGAGQAAAENARTANVFAGGEDAASLGDDGAGDVSSADAKGAAWKMFFALVSMMPLTAFIGHVGIEAYVRRFEKTMPNPEHQRAADDLRFHEGEMARLDRETGELNRRVAVLLNEENHAVAHARTIYLAERARLGGDDAQQVAHAAPRMNRNDDARSAILHSSANRESEALRAQVLDSCGGPHEPLGAADPIS